MNLSKVFLYGPSGSGKSTLGPLLAQSLDLPFFDLDTEIEAHSGMSVPQIFSSEQETGFRKREKAELRRLLEVPGGVIALGGGALLDADCRALVTAQAPVLLLNAGLQMLYNRLQNSDLRPLLAEGSMASMSALLERRSEHYGSFSLRLDTGSLTPQQALREAQILLGMFRVKGMQGNNTEQSGVYDVRIQPGGLNNLGEMFQLRGLQGPVLVISDSNVGPLYGQTVLESLKNAGYPAQLVEIPAGEEFKTIATATHLWDVMVEAGMERRSTVIALGGGVVSDLTGFVASTFLRGISWGVLPTTLLSMADASLGGKTAVDLPQGKNLAGTFYPPSLVLADPDTLSTLPEAELRSGLAEVVKHGVISDPELFAKCAGLGTIKAIRDWLPELPGIVQRAMAVKIGVIEADPYERNQRARLNLGHTIGHAVEHASGLHIRHGEGVAIGMVAEARIAEQMGLAQSGLAEALADVLSSLGLPTEIPASLSPETIVNAIGLDKKRSGGKVRFALPIKIGEVKEGVEVDDIYRNQFIYSGTSRP